MGRSSVEGDTVARDDRWSESIAIGSASFVEQVKVELGFRAQHRKVTAVQQVVYASRGGAALWDDFGRENKALRPFRGKQPLRQRRLSMVRPQCPIHFHNSTRFRSYNAPLLPTRDIQQCG
jgi:hypothetical protein